MLLFTFIKVVLKVEANDADDQWAKPSQQNERLKYSITKGNPQSHFQIDELTGYIVIGKRRLDREVKNIIFYKKIISNL